MRILMANMTLPERGKHYSPVVSCDATAFIKRSGIRRLAYNLANKWCWDIRSIDADLYHADGPCVFVSWDNTEDK